LWVFLIRGFEGGIWVFKRGDPLIPPGHGCYITKHLKLVSIHFGPKFLCGCFKFEGLKVELGFFMPGERLISNGVGNRGCEITKHLRIAHGHLLYYSDVFDVGMFV
jgi:hypothetical protein